MNNFCPKCGAPLNSGEKFCPKCGCPINDMQGNRQPEDIVAASSAQSTYHRTYAPQQAAPAYRTPKPKKAKKPMSKKTKSKIIAGSVIGVILAAGIVIGILFLSGSAFKAYNAVKAGDYDAAETDYVQGIMGNALQKGFLDALLGDYDKTILQAFENGDMDYDTACEALRGLQRIGLGDMSGAIEELTAIYEADEAFEKGNQYYQAGDYENAAKEYAKIPESSDKYQEVSSKLSDALAKYKASALEDAQALFEKEDYEGALTTLSEVRTLLENDSEVEAAYADYAAVYEKYCLDQADIYVGDNDYERAVSTLEHGLEVLPENSALTEKLNEIQTNKPIKLTDTNILYDGDGYELFTSSGSESFDIGSQTYHEGFTLRGRDSYALFDLGGEYTKMSFTVGRVNNGYIYDGTIQIYLNNKIVEEYPLSGEGAPQTITVNLAYAQTMKIQLVTDITYTTYGFANIYLEK